MKSALSLAALQAAQENKAGTSFGEKVHDAASKAATKAKIEAIKLKQRGLFTKLGSKLESHSSPDPSLTHEIAAASSVKERLQAVDEEIDKLQRVGLDETSALARDRCNRGCRTCGRDFFHEKGAGKRGFRASGGIGRCANGTSPTATESRCRRVPKSAARRNWIGLVPLWHRARRRSATIRKSKNRRGKNESERRGSKLRWTQSCNNKWP